MLHLSVYTRFGFMCLQEIWNTYTLSQNAGLSPKPFIYIWHMQLISPYL